MKRILFLILSVFLITACGNEQHAVNLNDTEKIHILDLKENHILLDIDRHRSTRDFVFITTKDTITNKTYNYKYGLFETDMIFEY